MIRNAHKIVEKFTVEPVYHPPSVFAVIPFEPRIKPKKQIEETLKRIIDKVEKELSESYPKIYVRPALAKFKTILNNLNFNCESRSVAVFLSPYSEKVLYLNMAVKEKVAIGEYYSVRDIIDLKKEETGLLVLVLSHTHSNLYHKNGGRLSLVVSNPAIPSNSDCGELSEAEQTRITNKCKQVDQCLSVILKSYSLPLLVVGEEDRLKSFVRVTKNVEHIVQFIPQSIGTITLKDVQYCIKKQEADWKKLKTKSLLLQLEHATNNAKIAVGIEDVWSFAKKSKAKLLVVEKSYVYPVYLNENGKGSEFNGDSLVLSDSDKIKDAVEDAIEHVLEDGGQIEIVDDNVLCDYMHMALIIK